MTKLKMIKDNQSILAYVNKGKSEIHWNGVNTKRNHFYLISLLVENYPSVSKNFISDVMDRFNAELIREIIDTIDVNLPNNLINYKLSNSRKELMFKLVTLRAEKLFEFL